MSIVVTKVYKNKIVMGADSFVGFSLDVNLKDKDVKIFKNKDIIIGCTGYASDLALLKLYCRNHLPLEANEDSIIDFMTEYVTWAKTKMGDGYKLNSYLMIAFKRKAFYIEGYYVKEIVDYRAMGAGQDIAQTALHLGRDVKSALEIACELSIYCAQPTTIYEMNI